MAARQENAEGSLWIFGFHVERSTMTLADVPLCRVTWSGTIGTEEIFSYHRYVSALEGNVFPGVIDALSTSVTDMLAQEVVDSLHVDTLAEMWPEHVVWTELKVAIIDPATGLYTDPDAVDTRVLTDAGSQASIHGLPYQSAHAVTTRSDHSKSQRSRNRFYLPTPTDLVYDGHGRLEQPVIDALLLWMALGQTSALADDPSYCFVNYSPADHAAKAIEDVYLGDVIDTIRRRRNKEPELRTVQALDQPTF